MAEATLQPRELPVGSAGQLSAGWWAMLAGIVSEAALFAYLLFSYYYFAIQPHAGPWPPEPMKLDLSLPNTVVLLLSSVAVWIGNRGTEQGKRGRQLAGLLLSFLLGAAFVIVQVFEWRDQPFSLSSNPFGSLYFTITGFHMAHVIAGVLILLAVLVWSALGYLGPERAAPVLIGSVYWHFVDAVWLVIFFTFYVTPHLG